MKKKILLGTLLVLGIGFLKLSELMLCSIEKDIHDISNINFNDEDI